MATSKHKKTTNQDRDSSEATEKKLPQEALWRPLYPFVSRYMKIGGFTCHYIDEAPDDWRKDDDPRPTLLLVHGNPTWSFYWRNVILAFREKYRVIAIDHIGCGLSEKPPLKDYPYTLDRRISDLATLVQKLNLQNIVLIAHDWGGVIALGAAERSPKRFSRFVLMNTGAFRSDHCPLRIRICRTPIINKLLVQGLNVFTHAAARMATSQPGGLPKDIRAGYLAPYNSWANRVAVFQFVNDIPLSDKHRSWERLGTVEQELSLFRDKPVALIWGMRDWCFTPEFLKRFLQFYPGALVHRIEKAGHYLVEDAFDEVVATIADFIESDEPNK
ncbi:MAG: alpha/beta fold hydrolase [Planctomycetia bacterium]|nr:alpha/beta fold hydrolase [Planctomycetia bacterium]